MEPQPTEQNPIICFFKTYPHWYLLIYWLIYLVLFIFVEQFYPVSYYHVIHSPLDDLIPFCEYFMIPYVAWYAFLVGIQVYTFFWRPQAFRRFIYFAALTYTTAIIIYMIYPNCQQGRPLEFVRDNFLTDIAKLLYTVDTSTNVCPSIHVIRCSVRNLGLSETQNCEMADFLLDLDDADQCFHRVPQTAFDH